MRRFHRPRRIRTDAELLHEHMADIAERARVRARIDEGVARQHGRPFVDLDVGPQTSAPAPRPRPGA